jgi:hypothetical protein
VIGEGIYGITITSANATGYNTTRWIGAAVVEDYQLSSPILTLYPSGNLTSGQVVMISAQLTYLNHPEFVFNGTVEFSVFVPGASPVVILVATKNNTTGLYQAVYTTPLVSSAAAMTIRVQATDIKDRISTNSTTTYVLPASNPTSPTTPPSSLGIIELGIVVVLFLVPIFAYLIEKYRRK